MNKNRINPADATKLQRHRSGKVEIIIGFCFGRSPVRRLGLLAVLLGLMLPQLSQAAGTWAPLANLAPGSIGHMLLLSDGTVMAELNNDNGTYGPIWYRLTPDNAGHYVNGTWTTLASMINTRLFFASQMLKDGRVFVAGGEYGTGGSLAEVYDPLANLWTAAPAPGHTFSDANSEILPDGRVMVALVEGTLRNTLLYDPVANTWSNGPTCNGIHNESMWVKLPDNSILMGDRGATTSERYLPALNQWIVDATVPVSLYDPYGLETGPGFLLPNGNVIFFGSSGTTAIYTPSGTTANGAWVAGPTMPNGQGCPDAPGVMLPNGRILLATSPTPTSANHFPGPTSFYEYDYVANTFTQVTAPAGGAGDTGGCFQRDFLLLPDGTALSSRFTSQLYVYTPDLTPLTAAKPAISSITPNTNGSYHLAGTQLNGISEGAAYGDDNQAESNYPLVRMTNSITGTVYYARTYNWSSTGVATGTNLVTTEFTLPSGLPMANYFLVAVANGIASDPVPFSTVPAPLSIFVPASVMKNAGTLTNAGTVLLASALPTNLLVTLTSSIPTRLTVTPSVTILAGQTSTNFNVTPVDNTVQDGNQTLTVTASAPGYTNYSASIIVIDDNLPPTITTQPTNQTLLFGSTATFSVAATGKSPLNYFWLRNGTPIAGATNTTYSVTNIQPADSSSQFSCLVTNAYGSTNTQVATLTVLFYPPTLTQQPTNQNLPVGFTASFSVSATGSPPLIYLWSRNSTPIAGETNTTYTATNVQVADSGSQFSCLVTNAFGVTNSQVATLTVQALPPAITQQPSNLTVPVNSSATFSVTATGSIPLSYFWLRNGAGIAGATNSSYTTNNVQLSDSGSQFSCLVTNAFGTAMSSTGLLSVVTLPTDWFTELFATTITNLAFNTYTYTPNGTANFYSVCSAAAVNFPTDPTGGTVLAEGDDTAVQITITNGNTVALYNTRTNVLFVGSNGYLTMNAGDTSLSPTYATHFSLPRVAAVYRDLNPTSIGTISWKQLADHVAVTYQGVPIYGSTTATNTFQIEMFFDGRIQITYLGLNTPTGLVGLSVGGGQPTNFVASDYTTYTSCAPQPPVIVTQPTNQIVPIGSNATFAVLAVGSIPLSYSWMLNGVPIPGATRSSFTTNNLTLSASGSQFSCLVTNAFGSTNSQVATLTVFGIPPAITQQPTNQNLPVGGTASVSVSASGSPPLAYAWLKNGSPIAGATNTTYAVTNLQVADSGSQFSCLVTNAFGTTNSSSANLTVTLTVDHFAWNTIASTQMAYIPFLAGITALNVSNVVATNFTGTVNLSASAGGGVRTNMLLGNILNSNSGNNGTFTLGNSFTPNTNLTVTHVRSYSGTKVSVWTDAGVLLAVQTVTNTGGTWVETPLTTPLALNAGTTYRVTFYSAGTTYYWRTDGANNFTDGVLNQGYEIAGDAFPTTSDTVRWWMVDLRYTVGSSVALPTTPVVSGAFTGGVWTGNVSVLQAASNAVLSASDGFGHAGLSNPFQVVANGVPPAITSVALLSNGGIQMTLTGYVGNAFRVLGSTNLQDWQAVAALTNLTGTLFFTDPQTTNYSQRFYRSVMP